jgi:flagellar biosynthetic protein FliO
MPPHYSWAQVWANLRPPLLKLARRPVVWISGLGLLLLAGLSQWGALSAPVSDTVPLPGQTAVPDLFGNLSLAASVTLKLAFVLALIYGGMFLLRRWPAGWLAANKKRVALLETTRLSPRQALHLVQVGDRTLLVGATDQAVTLLTEIDLPPESQAATAQTRPAPVAFTRALDQALNQPDLIPLTSGGNPQA